jgi:hypothetical protein
MKRNADHTVAATSEVHDGRFGGALRGDNGVALQMPWTLSGLKTARDS